MPWWIDSGVRDSRESNGGKPYSSQEFFKEFGRKVPAIPAEWATLCTYLQPVLAFVSCRLRCVRLRVAKANSEPALLSVESVPLPAVGQGGIDGRHGKRESRRGVAVTRRRAATDEWSPHVNALHCKRVLPTTRTGFVSTPKFSFRDDQPVYF